MGSSKVFSESDTFWIPNFLKPIFFRYQKFSKPIPNFPKPILFSIPKISETDTDTFFDTKIFRNRYRYFYRYQNFPKPIPIPLKKIKKFRNREVSKPKCQSLPQIPRQVLANPVLRNVAVEIE